MRAARAFLSLVFFAGVSAAEAAKRPPDGALDKTFGQSGKATLAFAPGEVIFPTHLEVQADGKLVGSGIVERPGTISVLSDGLLFRLHANGKPDTSFGTGGRVQTDLRQTAERWGGLAVQKDGKIVTAGDAFDVPGGLNLSDFAVGRFLGNGQPDPGFGGGKGFVFVDHGLFDQLTEVTLQKDGKIVAVGSTTGFDGRTLMVILRLLTNGARDAAFGSNGVVATLVEGRDALVLGVTIDKAGRILVAGDAGFTAASQSNPFVARFLASGKPDKKFDGDGFLTLTESAMPFGRAFMVAVQGDGKLVLSVIRLNPAQTASSIGVYRLQANGKRDTTFGVKGLVTIGLDTSFGVGAGLLVDRKNRILLGSMAVHQNRAQPALVRLTAAGKPDATFGKGGSQVFVVHAAGAGFGGHFALQLDGKIVMATANATQARTVVTRHLATN